MNCRYILFALFCFLFASVSSQTLEDATTMFNNGEYESAMPVFEKLVKATPSNGNYNFWYGVCCLKTGQPEEALKYLENAVKRKVPSGQLYLAENYDALYLFSDAITTYEAYIADLKRRKRSTEEAENALEKSKVGLRMLRNIDQVCVIDSFVVDKNDFLDTYKLSEEAGELFTYNEYFNTDSMIGTVYETELRDHIYYGKENEDGVVKIYSKHKFGDEWGASSELPERINGTGDNNYPFVMTDGITMFFASTGEHSMGGYDIFATRYNSDTDTYMIPENIGMPFNSPFNDYMFVIDEYNDLGWFASDRYQPEDKVCIYVFVPNNSNNKYNYDEYDRDDLIAFAQLKSIQVTWRDSVEVEEGLIRLKETINYVPTAESHAEFVFILDDATNYYHYSDFRSSQARELFQQYQQKVADIQRQTLKLEELRIQYINVADTDKSKLAPSIIDLEKRIDQMEDELTALEIQIRSLEKKSN